MREAVLGELTIRLDDATLMAIRHRAERLGTDVERIASDLLLAGLAAHRDGRAATAAAILARSRPSPISSVALLDEIRDDERR